MKRVLFMLGYLSDSDVEWIIEQGEKKTFVSGEHLIAKDKAIENMYIVSEGTFLIYNPGKNCSEIAQLSAGEILGEMSFLDSRPPSVSVQAITASASVIAVPLVRIKSKIKEDKRFAADFYQALASILSDRLRNTTNRLGYGVGQDQDEMSTEVMDRVGKAGSRFKRIVNQFAEA